MTYTTFLPSIGSGPSVPIGGQAEPDRARQILNRMAAHSEQGRGGIKWNGLLASVALSRITRMAKEGWQAHTDPQGRGPNDAVRAAGYKLPDSYSHAKDGNNIESLLWGGDGGLDQVWNAWMGSPHHRTHILGLNDFYAGQICVGVAHVDMVGSRWRHYYAILTCHPERS